jgi:excisionase family DNA binding protein
VSGRPELVAGSALLEALRPLVAELVEEELDRRLELEQRDTAPQWLTLEQAAARLGCSPDAVRMRARRGRLAYRHHGRRFYVSAESVDRLAGESGYTDPQRKRAPRG